MKKTFSLFVEVPWKQSNNHIVCFQVHDERVAKLFIDGFGLSTMDIEVVNATITNEEKVANESIYANQKRAVRRSAEIKPHEAESFDSNCAFCKTNKAVGKVRDPSATDDPNGWSCCCNCGIKAVQRGYIQVQED